MKREQYFSKLGVETAKAQLEVLVAGEDDVVDVDKLRVVCARCELPRSLRPAVWLHLVFAWRYRSNVAFLQAQQKQKFDDVARTVAVVRAVEGEKERDRRRQKRPQQLHAVFCVHNRLAAAVSNDVIVEELEPLFVVFCAVFDDDALAYSAVVRLIQSQPTPASVLSQKTQALLRMSPHANAVMLVQMPPAQLDKLIRPWFRTFFTCCLPTDKSIMIIDRILATEDVFRGSVMCAIAVALLTNVRLEPHQDVEKIDVASVSTNAKFFASLENSG